MGWRDWVPWGGAEPLQLPVRLDATDLVIREQLHLDAASVANVLSGLGQPNDKGAAARPNVLNYFPLDVTELLILWLSNGIARRICQLVPQEMTRKGWTVNDSTDDPEVMRETDRKLRTFEAVRDAKTWARLYGGAVILMVVDEELPVGFDGDPTAILATPLDPDRVNSVENLLVFDAWEATPLEDDNDLFSPGYQKPLFWQLTPRLRGGADRFAQGFARVHASRVLWFRGAKRPTSARFGVPRGLTVTRTLMPDDSVLQPIWDQIRNLSQVEAGAAVLAQEIRENVLKIAGLADLTAGDQKTAILARIKNMLIGKSLLHMTLIDEKDEFVTKVNSPAGYNAISAPAMAMVSAVTGIPQTILFGFAPSGFATDNQSGRQQFDRLISNEQADILPELERLYELVFASKNGPTEGEIPEDWSITFLPLDEVSEADTATMRKTIAETDAIYVTAAVLSPRRIRESRFGDDGWQFEIQPVNVEAAAEVDDLALAAADLDAVAGRPVLSEEQIAALMVMVEEREAEDRADADIRARRAALSTDEAVWLALIPRSERAIARIAGLRLAAAEALGLQLEHGQGSVQPHVTLLFVGPVPDEAMLSVLESTAEAMGDVRGPVPLFAQRIEAFPPGEGGRQAVVLRLESHELEAIHSRLLRALAPHVTVEQFPTFKAHLTLGWVVGDVDQGVLAEVDVGERFEPMAMVDRVVVMRGGEVVGEAKLARADAEDGAGNREPVAK